ncbi:hypothetical protein ABW19_dt0210154 [Dactylella cylindrospora]|nr:hypothetical protein ABW19_dt0210154 [Dactylella cylindrospora]
MSKPSDEKPKLLPYLGKESPYTIEDLRLLMDQGRQFPENASVRRDIDACENDLVQHGKMAKWYQGGKRCNYYEELDLTKPLWTLSMGVRYNCPQI